MDSFGVLGLGLKEMQNEKRGEARREDAGEKSEKRPFKIVVQSAVRLNQTDGGIDQGQLLFFWQGCLGRILRKFLQGFQVFAQQFLGGGFEFGYSGFFEKHIAVLFA